MQALFRLEKRRKFQALSTQMHTDWIDLFELQPRRKASCLAATLPFVLVDTDMDVAGGKRHVFRDGFLFLCLLLLLRRGDAKCLYAIAPW
jgi:hypothetical protein